MELSFLFSIIIILFLVLSIIGAIINKNIDRYSKSRFYYFISMFTSISVFILGVLFVRDSFVQHNKRKNK